MGFALAISRFGFTLSERASLFWPTKKLSVICALATGGAYMVLTGMHVPIIRSFAMACLLTIAILADRRPVSVRGLALAATALMVISPQDVPNVSFQMSFSAVLALIAGYEALRPWLRRLHGTSWHRRFASHLVALALTSALAGSASAPYGAYHFGHVQVYFVLANMVAVPLTALWVMPAGLIALLLMPLHLEALALVPMGWGAQAVVWVARATSALPDATIIVPHIPAWGLCVFSAGLGLARAVENAAAAFGRGGDAGRIGLAGAGSSARSAGLGRRAVDRGADGARGVPATDAGRLEVCPRRLGTILGGWDVSIDAN